MDESDHQWWKQTTCNTWDDPPSSDFCYHLVTSIPLFIEIFPHFSMFYWKCSSISHPFPHVLLGFLQFFLCFTGISHQFSQTFPCVSIKNCSFPIAAPSASHPSAPDVHDVRDVRVHAVPRVAFFRHIMAGIEVLAECIPVLSYL